jgi:hypothetical protein
MDWRWNQPEHLAQPEYILKQVLLEWQKLSRQIVNQQKSTPKIRGACVALKGVTLIYSRRVMALLKGWGRYGLI